MKAQKKLSPLRFGQSAEVREWENRQAKVEESDGLRAKGFFLVAEDDVSAIACDLEEMYSTAQHGFLCALDDYCIEIDATHPEVHAKLFPILEKLQDQLRTLSGKIEKTLEIA